MRSVVQPVRLDGLPRPLLSGFPWP